MCAQEKCSSIDADLKAANRGVAWLEPTSLDFDRVPLLIATPSTVDFCCIQLEGSIVKVQHLDVILVVKEARGALSAPMVDVVELDGSVVANIQVCPQGGQESSW